MDIVKRISELKKAKNAIILAHNYELEEIQKVADFCGDSLELSIKAAETTADVLIFCGVVFMAETAKILSPNKKVLLPVEKAPCDMADMVEAQALKEFKAKYDNPITVCYVNTTAATKALCDISVTSANALEIVGNLPKNRPIIFVPDKNLGAYCAKMTNREMILWEGYCPVHHRLRPDMVERKRKEYPNAEIIVHPEAPLNVIESADHALSTGGMLRFIANSDKETFVIATEIGILPRMERENPNKRFVALSGDSVCPYMKVIQLSDIVKCLEEDKYEVNVPEDIRLKAEIPIKRMLNKDYNF